MHMSLKWSSNSSSSSPEGVAAHPRRADAAVTHDDALHVDLKRRSGRARVVSVDVVGKHGDIYARVGLPLQENGVSE